METEKTTLSMQNTVPESPVHRDHHVQKVVADGTGKKWNAHAGPVSVEVLQQEC